MRIHLELGKQKLELNIKILFMTRYITSIMNGEIQNYLTQNVGKI